MLNVKHRPWKSKTKQRMVFGMIHVKDSLLPMGKVWSLDFLGIYIYIHIYIPHVSSTFCSSAIGVAWTCKRARACGPFLFFRPDCATCVHVHCMHGVDTCLTFDL